MGMGIGFFSVEIRIPTGENHIPIPMGMGIHMGYPYGDIHMDPHTHGIGNMIFPCGDPYGGPYGDSHRNPVGMGMEIPFPRQPWTTQTVVEAVPKGSYIHVADFDSPKSLALYLAKVLADDALYQSYFNGNRNRLRKNLKFCFVYYGLNRYTAECVE